MPRLDDYDYDLPKSLIAQHPVAHRPQARLMVVRRDSGLIEHAQVRDLPDLLRRGDCLVVNDTRVIPARLVGYRDRTGGKWEGLFLDAEESGLWRMICKTRGNLKPGETVTLRDRDARDSMKLTIAAALGDGYWVVAPEWEQPPLEILERVGRVPLPHYIREGEMVDADLEQYQTVYAAHAGSVAAPTAGLHFSEVLLERIAAAGIGREQVTLHVGLGTFRPIKSDVVEEHRMHSEWRRIPPETAERLNAARAAGGRIVAVGTTSVRTLESSVDDQKIQASEGPTDLFIHPPYVFQAVDALLTNFHLPKSTLLVLVRTFGGDALIMQAYEEAIAAEYRFFSYGDAMLIL